MLMNGLILCVMLSFGICTMECDFDSVGPECNFKNIAYKKLSRHDSNTNPPNFSFFANDNSLSTCSYTNENNRHKPWWNLWFSEYTTIKKLEFLTKDSHRGHFPFFTVKVYNTSEKNFQRKGHLEGGTTCYQYTNSILQETKIQVTCDGSPVGNLIRLQLYSEHYQLVLCDFRLYGDCNDGFYGNGCERCSDNCNSPRQGGDRYCRLSDGVCLNGCKSGWEGHRCENKCEDGKWGLECRNDCGKCLSSPCNHLTGVCKDGCAVGYKPDTECKTVCDDGSYGIRCESSCSANCNGHCDKETGTCLQCKAGWKGNFCTEKCEDGKWGLECQNDCGKCLSSPCNHVIGVCKDGCAVGYYPDTECKTVCDPGYFGIDCKQQCNRTCSSSGRAICNYVNGTCMNGCLAGYTGPYCEFGSVSRNKEVPSLKPTLIILGIISVVVLLYAIVITLFKRKRTQNASPGKQGNGSTPEVDVALSSDKGDETDHYNTINPQGTESAVYESIQTEAELSV